MPKFYNTLKFEVKVTFEKTPAELSPEDIEEIRDNIELAIFKANTQPQRWSPHMNTIMVSVTPDPNINLKSTFKII